MASTIRQFISGAFRYEYYYRADQDTQIIFDCTNVDFLAIWHPWFPFHMPNESIADKHPINIQIFCRKLRFRCQRILCIIFGVQDQVTAALTCLRSVETNLTLTSPPNRLFLISQILGDTWPAFYRVSLSLHRAGRREPWKRGWSNSLRTASEKSYVGMLLCRKTSFAISNHRPLQLLPHSFLS